MARRSRWYVRWRYAIAVAVLLLGGGFSIWLFAGKDIRLWWILRRASDHPRQLEQTERAIDELGLPYKSALASALRRGGRDFRVQIMLCAVASHEPFYLDGEIPSLLKSDDPVVRRAAATTLLEEGVESRASASAAPPDDGSAANRFPAGGGTSSSWTPGPLPKGVFHVLNEWADHVSDPTLHMALRELSAFRDPRIAKVLVKVVTARSTGNTLLDIGRANYNRAIAAQEITPYVRDDGVAEGLKRVVQRKRESSEVKMRVVQALEKAGYSADPGFYAAAARSPNEDIRQTVADNLEFVHDPRVIPILKRLLQDEKDTVRRGALDSLISKRAPVVMKELSYLAEDSFSSIRGDLADAVDEYGRKDEIPFVAWCLTDTDPVVVKKAIIDLMRMTGLHYGLTAGQWKRFRTGNYDTREKIIQAFMNDDARKEKAVVEWATADPPRYGRAQRIPALIRQLGHADPSNVHRAMTQLFRLTGRRDGFPKSVLKADASTSEVDDALHAFMNQKDARARVIRRWTEWWKAQNRKVGQSKRGK